jgi:hypothetical protein
MLSALDTPGPRSLAMSVTLRESYSQLRGPNCAAGDVRVFEALWLSLVVVSSSRIAERECGYMPGHVRTKRCIGGSSLEAARP